MIEELQNNQISYNHKIIIFSLLLIILLIIIRDGYNIFTTQESKFVINCDKNFGKDNWTIINVESKNGYIGQTWECVQKNDTNTR